MKRWKMMAVITVMTLGLGLSSCGSGGSSSEDTVAVQSVSMLAGLGNVGLQNRYAGVVVAQATHNIEKENERTVKDLKVAVGDEVKNGQILFTYDTDEIQMSITAGELELEKMQNTIDSSKKQIEQLEKDKKKAGSSEQLSYSIQIQTLEADIKETEYNISTKELELERLRKTLENSEVRANCNGIVQAINDGDSNGVSDFNSDGENAYITIVETGTYRVKGVVNEMNVSDIGMLTGEPVIIRSRVDSTVIWRGTMGEVDTQNAVKDQSSYYYSSDSDEQTSSSKYAFYVELDSSDGLMMGQHVYIELDQGQEDEQEGIWIASTYLDLTDGSYVWAATDKDKLEKREVVLGEYSEELDSYQILDGLTAEDYIAIPTDELKNGLAVTRYDEEYFDLGDYEYGDGEDGIYEDGVYEDGVYEDGMYEDGMYEDGVYEDGMYEDGVYEDGMYEDGVYEDGMYEDGVYEDGMYEEDLVEDSGEEQP